MFRIDSFVRLDINLILQRYKSVLHRVFYGLRQYSWSPGHRERQSPWTLYDDVSTIHMYSWQPQSMVTLILLSFVFLTYKQLYMFTESYSIYFQNSIISMFILSFRNINAFDFNTAHNRHFESLVVECWFRVREFPGSIPRQGSRHTKDVIKMVTVVPLFSTQH